MRSWPTSWAAREPPDIAPFAPGRFRRLRDVICDMTAPTSLAERAYVDLREEIIDVSLPPGTLLREDELMLRLGVGRTPVREAVQRLQRDGFVTVIPRRGTLVSEISITDLAAIYEVRKQLESWASRLAAERAAEGRPRGGPSADRGAGRAHRP